MKNLFSFDVTVKHPKGVFTWRRASLLCRDPASQLNSLSKFVFVYMRGGPALLGEISLLTTEISPRRAGNFHINALKASFPVIAKTGSQFAASACI